MPRLRFIQPARSDRTSGRQASGLHSAAWLLLFSGLVCFGSALAQSCPSTPPPDCGIDSQIAAGRWHTVS